MDAIELLKRDHQEVKELLKEFEQLGEGSAAEKRRLAEKVVRELLVHERLEEELFYPAYRNAADAEGKALVAESKEEHHVVDLIIDELQDVDVTREDFEAKFTVLKELVEHHIEEEETEMFPDARKLLKDQLASLGEEMAQYKDSLTRQVEEGRRVER